MRNLEKDRQTRKLYVQRPHVKERRCEIAKKWNRKNIASVLCTKAKKRAKDYNIPFNITKEDIVIPELCPILGIKLEVSSGKTSDNSYTLDKIVPELGYIKGNVVVLSHRANRIKSDANQVEIEMLLKWFKSLNNEK